MYLRTIGKEGKIDITIDWVARRKKRTESSNVFFFHFQKHFSRSRPSFPILIFLLQTFRKHKNQLRLLIKSRKIDLNCLICGELSKSYDDWELHVTSEKHVENAKRYKPLSVADPPPVQAPANIVPIPAQQAPSTASAIPPLLPPQELIELTAKFHDKLTQQALKQIVAKDRKEWNCVHCNVTCQSICSWEAHLASQKHRKNRHKFHTFPGISKDFVKRKYQNSFVRAAETFGEFSVNTDCNRLLIVLNFRQWIYWRWCRLLLQAMWN